MKHNKLFIGNEFNQFMTIKSPDFMGIWITSNNEKGYFFINILKNDQGKIFGTIEDTLGSATFDGEITPNKIIFDKKYIHSNGIKPAEPIHYEGKKSCSIYEGNYKALMTCFEIYNQGTFILEPYKPSITLDIIFEHLCKQNLRE